MKREKSVYPSFAWTDNFQRSVAVMSKHYIVVGLLPGEGSGCREVSAAAITWSV